MASPDPPSAAAQGIDTPRLDTPLDRRLGYQLRRASAAVLADLARSLGDLDLKPTEASVLLVIGGDSGITQSEIGRLLAIQRANMAPIAAMLTKRGLVERTRADGRSQGLRLSEAGAATAAEVEQRIDAHEARFLPDLPPQDRAALVALLRRIWSE